jgi:hypothetical protein
MEPIRVRDDDVLTSSSTYSDPVEQFKLVHEWICARPDVFLHVPSIIVQDLCAFPEAIDFIAEETAAGRMLPEIHGIVHIDYADLNKQDIQRHLVGCLEFIEEKFGHRATKWYTPWGAGFDERGAHLHAAAEPLNIEVIGVTPECKMRGRYGMFQRLIDGVGLSSFAGKDMFMHWWENPQRLRTILDWEKV